MPEPSYWAVCGNLDCEAPIAELQRRGSSPSTRRTAGDSHNRAGRHHFTGMLEDGRSIHGEQFLSKSSVELLKGLLDRGCRELRSSLLLPCNQIFVIENFVDFGLTTLGRIVPLAEACSVRQPA